MKQKLYVGLCITSLSCLLTGCGMISDSYEATKEYFFGSPIHADSLGTRASTGDASAQYQLGMTLLDKENPEGMKWLCYAAKHNHTEAQYQMGMLYVDKKSWNPFDNNTPMVPHDTMIAYIWFSLASDRSHEDADEMRREMEEVLGYAERSRAYILKQDWLSLPCPNGY